VKDLRLFFVSPPAFSPELLKPLCSKLIIHLATPPDELISRIADLRIQAIRKG
jgi:hypothetical protein